MLKYFNDNNINYEVLEDDTIEVYGYITFPMITDDDGRMTPYDIEMPEKLYVNGTLDLSNTNATHLPSEFKIDGSLNIAYTKISTLNQSVYDDLDISYSGIEVLDDNLSVLGNFKMTGSKVSTIPESTILSGSVDVSFSQVLELPKSLKTVKGFLNIANSKIEVLQDNLMVLGSLDASGSVLKAIPRNLTTTDIFNISNTPITEIPDDLTCVCLTITNPENFTNIAYRENAGKNNRMIFSIYTNEEYLIVAGCFMGTLEEFKVKAKIDYPNEDEYNAYVALATECIDELKEKLEA